jgi:hypothetical protein
VPGKVARQRDEESEFRNVMRDLVRKCRRVQANRKYNASQLILYQRCNFWYDVVLAVGTSGTVAGWAIWQGPAGKVVWSLLGAVVALLAIVKPILQLAKKIEHYTQQHHQYTELFLTIDEIFTQAAISPGALSPTAKNLYITLDSRFGKITPNDDPRPSRRVMERCSAEVDREISEGMTVPYGLLEMFGSPEPSGAGTHTQTTPSVG